MQKIISMALALLMAASVLCACGQASGGNSVPDETTQSTESLPSYAGQDIVDYDAQGNFILESSDNRKVFSYNSGYVVFSFTGESVANIKRVLEFDSAEEAAEYVSTTQLSQVENGEIPDIMTANGVYVIVPVAFSTDNESLGFCYTKTKTQIIAEFDGEDHAE